MPKKTFNFQGFERAHYQRAMQYQRMVATLFNKASDDIAKLTANGNFDPEKLFRLKDYPQIQKKVDKILSDLQKRTAAVINTGTKNEWINASIKNDAFLNSIFDTTKLSKSTLAKFQNRNLEALKSFQSRKINGMGLSDKIWRQTEQFRSQIELALDVGLGEGRSAAQLARDLRKNLNDPDRLYRRVRDKHGNLVLSKNAKAFNPGRGVYRSAARNAQRLARTETNMAYRESDHLRWQQLDFVVGVEIQTSDMHQQWLDEFWNKMHPGQTEICDQMEGKYPKDFKFVGWHPNCMCFTTPILMEEDDFLDNEMEKLEAAIEGREYNRLDVGNEITDMPQGFKDWVAENKDRVANAESTPYFIRDNFEGGDIMKPLNFQNDFIEVTRGEAGFLDKKSKALANKLGADVTDVNIKDIDRIFEKANSDYGGDVTQVRDIIRNTFIVPEDKIKEVLKNINTEFDVARYKQQKDVLGYTGHLFNIKTPSGAFAEIQVNTPQMIFAKSSQAKTILGAATFNKIKRKTGLPHGLGHKYYKEFRVMSKSEQASAKGLELIQKSNAYFDRIRNVRL